MSERKLPGRALQAKLTQAIDVEERSQGRLHGPAAGYRVVLLGKRTLAAVGRSEETASQGVHHWNMRTAACG